MQNHIKECKAFCKDTNYILKSLKTNVKASFYSSVGSDYSSVGIVLTRHNASVGYILIGSGILTHCYVARVGETFVGGTITNLISKVCRWTK